MRDRILLPVAICAFAVVSCASTASISSKPGQTISGQAVFVPDGKDITGIAIDLSAVVSCRSLDAFNLWTSTEHLPKFFGPIHNVTPVEGGAYEFAFFPDIDPDGSRYGSKGAKILSYNPPSLFAFEWIAFAADAKMGAAAPPADAKLHALRPPPTWVQLDFTPLSPVKTEVRLRHFGFDETPQWHASRAWFDPVWGSVLSRFKAKCEELSYDK